jgi:hypothetical protein
VRILHLAIRASVAALLVLVASLVLTGTTPTRAEGDPPSWTVSLAVSLSSVTVGSSITLTATASQDVGANFIDIVTDVAHPELTHVALSCNGGTTCTTTVHFSTAGFHTYYAIVDLQDWTILAQSAPQTVTWSSPSQQSPQSYTIDPIADHHLGDPPITVTGRGTYVHSPAFWLTGQCTTNDEVHVIMTAVGSCTVSIFLPGGNGYTSFVSPSVTFKILLDPTAVTWPSPAYIPYGTPLGSTQLNAMASIPGTFSYTPAVGTVLPVGASQVLTTTFTPAGSVNIAPITATTTMTVTKSPQRLTVYQLPNLTVGAAVKIVTTTGDSGEPVVVTASGACTVASDGVTLTPTATGSCTVTANETGNAQFLDAPTVTQVVQVQAASS